MHEYPAEFYEALHTGTPGDLDYYRRHCESSASLLELGCGNGRVLAALASPSRRSVGIDIHPGLVQLAKTRLQDAPGVEVLEQDMLALKLDGTFDRIILPFCGIYCVESAQDLDALFAGVAQHLSPQGQFILDTYSAEHFHADQDEPDEEQVPHEHGTICVRGVEYQVYEQSRWDRSQQRILVSYLHAALDADAATAAGLEDEVVAELSHHYWLASQIQSAAQKAGLQRTLALGDFEGAPWEEGCPWHIFHFERDPSLG